MRERRWESSSTLPFQDILDLCKPLSELGSYAIHPGKDLICYIEEWGIQFPEEFRRLDPWPTEDVTLIHIREGWCGDFYLLSGGYHSVYQHYLGVGTYCSVSHPWKIPVEMVTHESTGRLWVGFRGDRHTFIRIRLHTREVITPGETRDAHRHSVWLEERQRAFQSVIQILDLPLGTDVENAHCVLRVTQPKGTLFCSWPDAFGPCQFEYNSTDLFEFLVPASRLAATHGKDPAGVRIYLTGFSQAALKEFEAIEPGARYAYRCSAHCKLQELPEVHRAIFPAGSLYATLCEFQTGEILPHGKNAWVIIGIMGAEDGFRLEARLSRAPLPEDEMDGWLQSLLGHPMRYAPLPPFP